MRVYLPATFPMLEQLHSESVIHARNGWAFALTPALREFYTSGDDEELSEVAFDDAALASIRLLAIDSEQRFPHRRVVISADVDDDAVEFQPEMGESVVRLSPAEVALRDVAALHIDLEDAEADIKRALAVLDAAELGDEDAQLAVGDAAEHFLAWYDPTELPFVVELL